MLLGMHVAMDAFALLVSATFFPGVALLCRDSAVAAVNVIGLPMACKVLIRWPRPTCGASHHIGPDRHGMPSGHAFFAGVLCATHPAAWTLAYALLLSWSRLRRGVHAVEDVVVGVALGVALAPVLRSPGMLPLSLPMILWWWRAVARLYCRRAWRAVARRYSLLA